VEKKKGETSTEEGPRGVLSAWPVGGTAEFSSYVHRAQSHVLFSRKRTGKIVLPKLREERNRINCGRRSRAAKAFLVVYQWGGRLRPLFRFDGPRGKTQRKTKAQRATKFSALIERRGVLRDSYPRRRIYDKPKACPFHAVKVGKITRSENQKRRNLHPNAPIRWEESKKPLDSGSKKNRGAGLNVRKEGRNNSALQKPRQETCGGGGCRTSS